MVSSPLSKQNYVAGFMTDFDFQRFVLIDKGNKLMDHMKINLRWQGIGGKIELTGSDVDPASHMESPHEAMVREFKEETGISTKKHKWHCFLIKEFTHAKLYFFVYFCPPAFIDTVVESAKDCPEGQVMARTVIDIYFDPGWYTYDIQWMIPMLIREARSGFLTKLDPEGVNTSGKN